MQPLRLGVNIDHVATLRNARLGEHPSVVTAAGVACAHGADGITVHLREDRRHIRDDDVEALLAAGVRLNLEMAACEEMVAIAERLRPSAVCFVPERREEQTTEGGLDVVGGGRELRSFVARARAAGCEVSFVIVGNLSRDQCSHGRIARLAERYGDRFLSRVFSEGEIAEAYRSAGWIVVRFVIWRVVLLRRSVGYGSCWSASDRERVEKS